MSQLDMTKVRTNREVTLHSLNASGDFGTTLCLLDVVVVKLMEPRSPDVRCHAKLPEGKHLATSGKKIFALRQGTLE